MRDALTATCSGRARWRGGREGCLQSRARRYSPPGREPCQGAQPGGYRATPHHLQSSSSSSVFGLLESNFDNVTVVMS